MSNRTFVEVPRCREGHTRTAPCDVAVTYSSVPTSSETYLGVDEATLNIMLAYGPIAFCLAVYPAAALLSSRPLDGLRLTIRLGAAMCLTAAILRTIPVLISSRADAADAAGHDSALALTHVAQFINAAVGPLIVASPAVLSRAWFPPAQRNTATAVANTANALGRAVGFFLGPALVSTASQVRAGGSAAAGPTCHGSTPRALQLPLLLVVTLVCSALPAVAVFAWLPNPSPPLPHAQDANPAGAAPAASARAVLLLDGGVQAGDTFYYDDGLGRGGGGKAVPESGHTDGGGLCGSAGDVARQACAGLRSASFCLVALSGGSTMAVWGAWSGVLPAVMTPQFSADQAGAVGSVATFASIAGAARARVVVEEVFLKVPPPPSLSFPGGIATGLACDHPLLRARLRVVTVAVCLAASLGFWVLAAALPPIAAPALASRITFWPILAVVAFAGGWVVEGCWLDSSSHLPSLLVSVPPPPRVQEASGAAATRSILR